MAMSRAEIELLIKAKNEAQGAFDGLTKQIKGITGESDKASESQERLKGKTNSSGVAAGAAGVAFGLLAERVGRGLVSAFQDTIAAANRLDAGLIGLQSVARAFKQDAAGAEEAAKKLAADGLMSVGESAAGLKNLLAAGFGLPEAVTLMNRFKDSAAFGKQGALEFGQAIVGATEGLKNGNSALVDNAGVTKNLSNILQEAGFSASDLSKASSDVNVRMALFNGIVKETNPQLGDAARYLDTAAGKQAQFNSQIEIAQQKIGKALQPALASALNALLPLIQAIGNAAPVLVPLGIALGAVVTPLIAMKAAAALGIPSITGLGTAMGGTLSVFKGIKTFGDARAGIQLLGDASGLTTGNLGKLGSAAAVAGAAFAGWQIGRAIAQVFDLDTKIANLTARLMGWGDLAGQTAGAKQDVINRAMAQGAAATISYTDAIKFNENALAARATVLDGNTAALRKKLDAQLALGQITKVAYDDELILLGAEERRNAQAASAAALRTQLSGAEKKYRDEIAATGQTVGQLQAAIAQNEDAFKKWAETAGLSDTTVSRLKESLTASTKAKKDAATAAKELAEAQKKLTEEFEQATGVLSRQGLNDKLAVLEKQLSMAASMGSKALTTAVKALWPELLKLREQAAASGLSVANLDGVMSQAAEAAGLINTQIRTFNQFVPLVAGVTEAHKVNTAEVRVGIAEQEKLAKAYKAFGLTTKDALNDAAEAARENYATLAASGTATTAQLKSAYQQMIDAQREATGKVPGFWQTEVYPSVKRTIEQLGTAVQGSFAQMLLGAKGFGDGFKDIWESIKASALRVFTEILSAFTNRFLKGLLGAMSGQQGAFSQAFGGLFGGGGGAGLVGGGPSFGGGGGILGQLGGLFGGGGAVGLTGTGSSASIAAAGLGFPGGAGGGAAGLGGLGAAGIFGGLGAGAAGFGLGRLGQGIFGGAGAGAGAFGAGSGAATGALIGSIVPGLGTAVGAIIGGLTGVLGGLLGKSKGEKTNDVRDSLLSNFGGAGTGEGSGFHTLAAKLTGAGAGEGGGQLFQDFIKANDLKELEAAMLRITAALQAAETAATEAGDATADGAKAGADGWADSTAAIQQMEAEAQRLALSIDQLRAGGNDSTELEKELAALQQRLVATKNDAATLNHTMQAAFGPTTADGIEKTGTESEILKELLEKLADGARLSQEETGLLHERLGDVSGETGGIRDLSGQVADLWRGLQRARDEADNLGSALGSLPSVPGGGGSGGSGGGSGDGGLPVEGGAAGGILASRPGLVLFGEGGEPELGGPVDFMARALAGALGQLGATAGAAGGGGGGPMTVVPLAFFMSDSAGRFDGSAVNRHLASTAGITSNEAGLREVIESIAASVFLKMMGGR
jgi:hypothetical protein